MKWDYKTIELPFEGSPIKYKDLTELLNGYDSVLNKAGAEGWELVAAVAPGVFGPKKVLVGIFKRPVE